MESNLAIWIAILPAVMMGMAPLLTARKDPQREKALDKYARKVNLAMTPEVRPRVIARIRSFEKASMIGAGIGLAVGLGLLIIFIVTGDEDSADILPLVVFGLAAIGGAYGPVVAAVRHTLRPTPGRRIARPSAPDYADYVPTLERISGPAGLGCTALALIVGGVLLSTGLLRSDNFTLTQLLLSPGVLIGCFGLVTWIAALIVGRLVLRTGQVAGSEQELAWDDALRSVTLRGVATMPFAVSVLATLLTFFTVFAMTSDVPQLMLSLGAIGLFGYLTAVCIAITMDALRNPAQHYWRRLWKQRTEQPA